MKKSIHIVILFFITLTSSASSSNNNDRENFIVAIDIGHTPTIQGTTSSRGIGEYVFNKNMAHILLSHLHKSGFSKTFIVGENKTALKLKERTAIAKKKGANIFISIHHDSVQEKYLSYWKYKGKKNRYSDKFKGYSLFINNNNENINNYLLASDIGEALQNNNFSRTLHHAEKIKGENRKILNKAKGIYEFNDLIVLKTAIMPAVLIECGVIVNRNEEKLLSNSNYQKSFVNSIVSGIDNYYTRLIQK